MPESSDPYTYPGTNVLRNLADIRDPVELAKFEADVTGARIFKLDSKPLKGRFDLAHLKAIHRYIFQDVFSWAGKFRTVNISKGGHLFGAAQFIEPAVDDLLRKLAAEQHLKGADCLAFARRAGFYMAEINAIHPFREGNGRTQREFIRELAAQAGFAIDWGRVSRAQMTEASIRSFKTGDSSGMAGLIELCMQLTDK